MDNPNTSYQLEPGYVYTSAEEASVMTVVGTSVAVSIFDKTHKSGGVCNFLYPKPAPAEPSNAYYGTAAITALVRNLLETGAKTMNMESQIFGGAASEESPDSRDIGEENIQIARKMLNYYKIKIVSESVGGSKGKKLIFKTNNGEVLLYKSTQVREGDWYPYKARI